MQRIRYMFAVGPPRSLTVPLKSGDARERLHLAQHRASELRLWMMRPWCIVIEQNVQPPKQPRMIVHRVA